jgi:hypothetical protein
MNWKMPISIVAYIGCHKKPQKPLKKLESKPLRVGFPDIPVPSAPGLSKDYYPGPAEIAMEICNSIGLVLNAEEIRELKGNGPYDIPRQGLVGPF